MTEHFTPHSILPRIDATDAKGLILRRLCAYHPSPVRREELMAGARLTVGLYGRVTPFVKFYWAVERINDELPSFGWRVNEDAGQMYRLVRT